MRARFPDQPLAISEYGAGGALTHHTDDVLGGPPEVRSAPPGEVSYQPEEYQAYVHEEVYRLLNSRPYLWGSFIWNMFDFGSDHRNEGDVLGVNTKGLVTFDRQTRKDAFYFYQANWSDQPVTHIVGRRYTDRAYPVNDVKVYTNARSVELWVGGVRVGAREASECPQATCVFEDVVLEPGVNVVTASANHGDELVTDAVEWSVDDDPAINIAAGWLASGYVASDGDRFGSDHFYTGGTGAYIELGRDANGGTPDVSDTEDPLLFKYFRGGAFGYDIPLPNGTYGVTLGFVEPDRSMEPGQRVFDVQAEGQMMLDDYDVRAQAGAAWSAVHGSFTIDVTDGTLNLDFVPSAGEAVVSNIRVAPFAVRAQ